MGELDQADLLHGMPAIAAFLGLNERQARHLDATNDMPTFRLGGRICARRSTLRTWLASLEQR